MCVPSNGTGNSFYPVGGGESGYIAPDPQNNDVFYAGSFGGYMTRYDRSTGQSRWVNIWPEYPVGQSAGDLKERFQWTTPIVFSATEPNVLYVGSQHLWKTGNEGQTWERISPDLTRHDPATLGPSGGPINRDQTGVETYATIFAIAPSRQDPKTIWVGSDDGLVHITRDGGANWEKITPRELPDFSRIGLIEASPHKPGTAYLAANRYQSGDRAPYVFVTDDFGKSWRKITSGIAPGDFARVIREDAVRPGMLYLGTEHGIYLSYDNGGNWQSLRLNLPDTPVHGIVSEHDDLVIATHGRSFYVLDQVDSLRQWGPEIAQEEIHLFAPGAAVRSVSRGMTVDYYLRDKADQLTLEIYDGAQLISRFTDPPAARVEDKDAGFTESSRAKVPKLPAQPGLNRFVWDLHYFNAVDFPGLIMYQTDTKGPLMPPGQYTIFLKTSTTTKHVIGEIEIDPRLTKVSKADLQEQFRLSKQIHDRFSQANQAVIDIRAMNEQLKDRVSKSHNERFLAAAQLLMARLGETEGEIYQVRNRATKDPLNFPPKLNNKLSVLRSLVDSADARPTDSSYAVFRELSAKLDEQLSRLEAMIKNELPPLNTMLTQSNMDPVKPPVR